MPHNIEIGKIGTFTDSKGITKVFDDKFFSDVTSSYNSAHYKAPFIIGHNTKGVPDDQLAANPELSFGFPSQVKRVKDRLVAVFDEISPRIKQFYKKGDLLSLSPSFYPPNHKNNPTPGKWSLRHVAGLGVTPPAIKGLRSPALAFAEVGFNPELDCLEFCMCGQMEEDGSEQLTFSMYGNSVAEAIGRLRDWLIETNDLESANKIIPPDLVENLRLGDRIKDQQMDRLEEKVYKIAHKLKEDHSDSSLSSHMYQESSQPSKNMTTTIQKTPTHLLLSRLASEQELEFSDIAETTGFSEKTVAEILLGAKKPTSLELEGITKALTIDYEEDDDEIEFEGHSGKKRKMKMKMKMKKMKDQKMDEDEDEDEEDDEENFSESQRVSDLQAKVLELEEYQEKQERLNRARNFRVQKQLEEFEEQKEVQRQERISEYCEQLVREGKLLASQIGDRVIEFGEEGNNVEMDLPGFLLSLEQDQLNFAEDFLGQLTPQLPKGEFAPDNGSISGQLSDSEHNFAAAPDRAISTEGINEYQAVIDFMEANEGYDINNHQDFDRAALIVFK